MCGLFGLVSKAWNQTEREILADLCLVSSLRGKSSTGVAFYIPDSVDNQYFIIKNDKSAGEYLMQGNVREMLRRKGLLCAMGHTRSGTPEIRNLKDTHPWFLEGPTAHIVGCHNGGVPSFSTNKKIDSYNIFQRIADVGLHKTVTKFKENETAALTWMNLKTNTLNFYRNAYKPIYLTTFYNDSTLMWASESGMLEFVIRRHNLKPDRIVKMCANDWLQFDMSSKRVGQISRSYTIRTTDGNIKETNYSNDDKKEEDLSFPCRVTWDHRMYGCKDDCYMCGSQFKLNERIDMIHNDEGYCELCQQTDLVKEYLREEGL